VWLILNDHRPSINSTHHNGASTSQRATEEFFYRDEVIG
jgi:hypothetical protein